MTIAFTTDTRWKGVHPINLNAANSAKLDGMLPKGFKYTRDLQSEIAFIPPLNHARAGPNIDFVIPKRGCDRILIVKPNDQLRKSSPESKTKTSAAK